MSFEPINVDMQVAENDRRFEMQIVDQFINPTWDWMKGASLVRRFDPFKIKLSNTSYPTWTPTTTATSILATADFGTFVADMANYDYIIKWTFDTGEIAHNSGATLKVTPKRCFSHAYQTTFRRPATIEDALAETFNQNQPSPTVYNLPLIEYYNSNGNDVVAYSTYGFYATAQQPTFSANYADDPTVTLKRPVIYARCSTTYFATARASEIDQANTEFVIGCEIYRTRKDWMVQTMWKDMIHDFNGGD